jgi:hypothetical protein
MATPTGPDAAFAMLARYQEKQPRIIKALEGAQYAKVEYRSVLMDVLDAIESAPDIQALRNELAEFDIEPKDGIPPWPLRQWWEMQHAREAGKGLEFFTGVDNE